MSNNIFVAGIIQLVQKGQPFVYQQNFPSDLIHDPGHSTLYKESQIKIYFRKFQLLIKTKILTNEEVSCLKSLRCCINHANKC